MHFRSECSTWATIRNKEKWSYNFQSHMEPLQCHFNSNGSLHIKAQGKSPTSHAMSKIHMSSMTWVSCQPAALNSVKSKDLGTNHGDPSRKQTTGRHVALHLVPKTVPRFILPCWTIQYWTWKIRNGIIFQPWNQPFWLNSSTLRNPRIQVKPSNTAMAHWF